MIKFIKWFTTYFLWFGLFIILFYFVKIRFEIITFSGLATVIAYIIELKEKNDN